jgi:hypothetical protein
MTRKKTISKDTQYIPTDAKPKMSKKDQISGMIKKSKDKFLTQSQREYYDKLVKNQIYHFIFYLIIINLI